MTAGTPSAATSHSYTMACSLWSAALIRGGAGWDASQLGSGAIHAEVQLGAAESWNCAINHVPAVQPQHQRRLCTVQLHGIAQAGTNEAAMRPHPPLASHVRDGARFNGGSIPRAAALLSKVEPRHLTTHITRPRDGGEDVSGGDAGQGCASDTAAAATVTAAHEEVAGVHHLVDILWAEQEQLQAREQPQWQQLVAPDIRATQQTHAQLQQEEDGGDCGQTLMKEQWRGRLLPSAEVAPCGPMTPMEGAADRWRQPASASAKLPVLQVAGLTPSQTLGSGAIIGGGAIRRGGAVAGRKGRSACVWRLALVQSQAIRMLGMLQLLTGSGAAFSEPLRSVNWWWWWWWQDCAWAGA
jgi:hypothetical protein